MIIPRNTKPKRTIFSNYTLLDLLFILIFAGIIIGFGASNLKTIPKIIICIVILLFGVILFLPKGEELVYYDLIRTILYLFESKKFALNPNKHERDISQVIPYEKIEKGGYIVYPGYFGKVIQLKCIDFYLQDDTEQSFTVSHFANALKCLEGYGADLVKLERPMIMDRIKNDLLEQFAKMNKKNDVVRSNILLSRIDDVIYYNEANPVTAPFYFLVLYAQNKEKLNDIVDAVSENLKTTGVYEKELKSRDVAIFLKYANLNDFDERDIRTMKDLEKLKPDKVEFKRDHYRINDKYASLIAIKEYPLEVFEAWGDALFNMDGVKVVCHIKPVVQTEAIKRIDNAIKELLSRGEQAKESDELKNDTHIDTMRALLEDMQTANQTLMDVSITVTCYADSEKELKIKKKKIIQKLKNEGFEIDQLYFQQQNAFINSNISSISKLKRFERGINSSSLGAIFPFTSTVTLDKGGIMLGFNDYPFILDIWKRGGDYQNSNAFVIGTSGSGKSFFTKTLLMNLYSDNCDIFILDPENEYSVPCINLHGTNIDVGNSTKGRINPFHIYNVLTENGEPASGAVVYSSHLRTLESFYKIVFEGASVEVLETINNITVLVYRKKGIDETLELEKLTPEDFPTFQDLYEELLAQEKVSQSEIVKTQIQRALMYVRKFVDGGRYSQVWNGPSTLQANTDFTVFNFQTLFANKNQVVANAQMLLVFKFLEQEIINRREKNMAMDNIKHTVIIADEAHLFIDPKFPVALDFFYQMTKRIRKYGGSFIPITQSISDWNANEELAHKTTAILKESQYNFILKLKPSGVENLADLYSAGSGINTSEQRSIIEAKTGSMFMIGSDKMHTFFDVEPSEYVRYLFEKKGIDENIFKEILKELKENNNDYTIDIKNKFLEQIRKLKSLYEKKKIAVKTIEESEEDKFWEEYEEIQKDEDDIDINIEKSESEQENDAQSEENSEDNKSIEKIREEVLEKHKLVKKQKNSTVAKFATTQNEKEPQEIENTEEKIKQDTGKKQLKVYRKQQRTKRSRPTDLATT